MPLTSIEEVRARRKASVWTLIHPIFALGQLLAFFVSVGLLVAYFFGRVSFGVVHIAVMTKIGLMVGAVITGALWEKDVFGSYWFAAEFLVEDVMTVNVFILQIAYVLMAYTHPENLGVILWVLGLAYFVYAGNVTQYIVRTANMQKNPNPAALQIAA
jgi:3-vinyl bacteriochlorophyllide hydratase